jgi:hypothetical protein
MYISGPSETVVDRAIEGMHLQYRDNAVLFCWIFWVTRVCAGVSAAVLPFVVHASSTISTILSLIIVVCTVIDTIWSPKERWTLYSKATDLLSVAKVKKAGDFEGYKELLEVVLQTESAALQQLINLDDLVNKLNAGARAPSSN